MDLKWKVVKCRPLHHSWKDVIGACMSEVAYKERKTMQIMHLGEQAHDNQFSIRSV